ncbi:hypothetical protein DFH09DRAFT_1305965 [Mycena vulgaris]|nr:hypothetical protein DFH09DRAFT_1305965 [Mycena vulgaris]
MSLTVPHCTSRIVPAPPRRFPLFHPHRPHPFLPAPFLLISPRPVPSCCVPGIPCTLSTSSPTVLLLLPFPSLPLFLAAPTFCPHPPRHLFHPSIVPHFIYIHRGVRAPAALSIYSASCLWPALHSPRSRSPSALPFPITHISSLVPISPHHPPHYLYSPHASTSPYFPCPPLLAASPFSPTFQLRPAFPVIIFSPHPIFSRHCPLPPSSRSLAAISTRLIHSLSLPALLFPPSLALFPSP